MLKPQKFSKKKFVLEVNLFSCHLNRNPDQQLFKIQMLLHSKLLYMTTEAQQRLN